MATDTVTRDGAPVNGKRAGGARSTVASGDAPFGAGGGFRPLMVTGTTTNSARSGPLGVSGVRCTDAPDSADDANKFVLDVIKFSAFGDRVIIQEDEFKSGYECSDCKGSGLSPLNPLIRCKSCDGKGATIHVPETSQRRPTTGTIVSVGAEVKTLKVGQAVLYSSFAGHTIDLDRAGRKVVLRLLHEPEILCLVEGHLELKTVRGKSDIASFQN